ncbi:MAG: serine/threonine-protein kinase [Polyangiaceae bacterium]
MSSGGMATVHFGRLVGPAGFSRTVAIKRLHPHFAKDPNFVSMFVDEARLVSRISHPNVIPTLDVVSTQGELFLVMDYVHGESLSKLLTAVRAQNARVSPHIVSAIMGGVLRGLHAAHEATHPKRGALNIVHRDISPQNVLVGVDGSPRVLDFGVAKALDRVQEMTREGQLKGKLAYMAPEQFSGGPVTRAIDIFAASVVLWEALTARRLFASEKQADTVMRIVEQQVKPPSNLMIDPDRTVGADAYKMLESLDRIVLRGLEKDPTKRFPTAREMAQALEWAMPPASPSEVTEWVEIHARGALAERSEMLGQLATDSISRIATAAPTRPMSEDARQRSTQTVNSSEERPSGSRRTPPNAGLSKAVIAFVALMVAVILVSVSLISYTLMHGR